MSDKLEQLLKQIPLHKPSSDMDRRVFGALSQRDSDAPSHRGTAKPLRLPVLWIAAGSALAACVTLVIVWQINRPGADTPAPLWATSLTHIAPKIAPHALPPVAATTGADVIPDFGPNFDPVRIDEVWTGVLPEGVVYVNNETPMRRYHRQVVQRVQFVDPKRNIRIELTVPRDDVVVTPVSYD